METPKKILSVKYLIQFLLVVFLITTLLIPFNACQKPNTPPIAAFTINPSEGNAETIFTFNASNCSDAEDDQSQLLVHWDWENDGIWDTEFSTNKIKQHQYEEYGIYTIVLEIKDSHGYYDNISMELVVEEYNSDIIIDVRDGQEYKTIKIGNQWWTAENLNFSTETGSWCYNNEPENCYNYGRLYEWSIASLVCPIGWHLPDDHEWIELEMYLGMSYEDAINNTRRGPEISQKIRSTNGWNCNGNNESGFNGLPAGFRLHLVKILNPDLYYHQIGVDTNFWTSTIIDNKVFVRRIGCNNIDRLSWRTNSGYGLSIRCVKD